MICYENVVLIYYYYHSIDLNLIWGPYLQKKSYEIVNNNILQSISISNKEQSSIDSKIWTIIKEN